MEKVKKLAFVFVRLLMLDKKYWTEVHSRFAGKTRILYNGIIDQHYIGESLGEIVYSEALLASGAYQTQSAEYLALFHAFRRIKINKSDVIVDVGCGKGRAILWVLKHYKADKIYGIELNDEVAEETAKRLEKYDKVTIIHGDAIENIPPEATIFYLYNPFIGTILKKFKLKLEAQFYQKKSITIVYHNPIYLKVFLKDPKWTVEYYRYKPTCIRKLLRFRQQDTAIVKLKL